MGHKRDWKQYNKQLVARGKINFWVSSQALRGWKAFTRQKKNGHPFVYSDEIVKAMCFIRFKFHLGLRETEGFFRSLIALLGFFIQIPCYTQLCRRMKCLGYASEFLSKKDVADIVLDTTGLKIYGEGEWRAEKYGGRKAWKKLHLAMDLESGKLLLAEITDEYVHDTTYVERALQRANARKGKVLMDGIADSRKCYEIAAKYNKVLLSPPKKGAVLRKEKGFEQRNEAIRVIRGLGNDRLARSIWSKLVGYNRRVVVESMMSRWKRLYGSALRSRCEQRQKAEVQVKAMMINLMISGQAA